METVGSQRLIQIKARGKKTLPLQQVDRYVKKIL